MHMSRIECVALAKGVGILLACTAIGCGYGVLIVEAMHGWPQFAQPLTTDNAEVFLFGVFLFIPTFACLYLGYSAAAEILEKADHETRLQRLRDF